MACERVWRGYLAVYLLCVNILIEMSKRNLSFGIVSGIFGTVGSSFGKAAANYALSLTEPGECLLKVIFLNIMIISNTVGCGFFVKALNASGSSLPPTIASAATSYLSSAILGWLVFHETVSTLWWFGILLILLGLLSMYRSFEEQFPESSKERVFKRD